MDFNLNRTQYIILKIMEKEKAASYMCSMSCYEIAEIEKQNKVPTIYKYVQELIDLGLIVEGAKVVRAKGYYLTQDALELLKEA